MTKNLLKNKLTTAFLALAFLALVPAQTMAQKKVLFICNSAFAPAAGASAADADVFIATLTADPTHFTVTTITTVDGTTSVKKNGVADTTALLQGGTPANSSPANIAAFYANYDLVVTQESFGSASAIWKPAGLLGIKNITIPVIYTKGYAMRSTSATVNLALTDWSTNTTDPLLNIKATAVLGSKLTITVPPANQTNPLFTGIDFSGGNDIALFKALATDPGLATGGTKAVDQVYNANITDIATGDLANQKTTLLASIAPATGAPTAVNDNSLMCVNDIPGGTYFGTAGDMLPSTSRMIFFAFNYGATALGYSTGLPADSNVTDAGLTIFKNAALILTSQSMGVKENVLASASVSVSPNPTKGPVTINSTSPVNEIVVFDTKGKKVLSAKNTSSIDLTGQASGMYFAKIKTDNGTVNKKIIVK